MISSKLIKYIVKVKQDSIKYKLLQLIEFDKISLFVLIEAIHFSASRGFNLDRFIKVYMALTTIPYIILYSVSNCWKYNNTNARNPKEKKFINI